MVNSNLNNSSFHNELNKLVSTQSIDSALVALSGGPDSVAMLHLMNQVAQAEKITLFAAHLNYSLRGEESDQDQKFCVDLCKKMGIKLYKKKVKLSKTAKGNLQQTARKLRYDFFQHLTEKHDIDNILIAHNLDDNAETLLMNLCRGAGTFGLAGIEAQRDQIIRPLLNFSREQILDYLDRNNLPYRTDSSNLENYYRRNRIRQEVLPLLENICGKASKQNIASACQILSLQKEYLQELSEKLLNKCSSETIFGKLVLDTKEFSSYNILLKHIVLSLCLERISGSREGYNKNAGQRVLDLLSKKSGKVDFVAGLLAEIVENNLYLFRRTKKPKPQSIKIPGILTLPEFRLKLISKFVVAGGLKAKRIRSGNNYKVYLDADLLGKKLALRSFQAGDSFTPLGMNGKKKLSDYFIDRKIARPLREEIPLLCQDQEVYWIIGHEISDKVKISGNTKNIIKLEVI